MDYAYTIIQNLATDFIHQFLVTAKGTTALTEEACDFVTKNIRIPVMPGEWDGETSTLGSAVVGSKL